MAFDSMFTEKVMQAALAFLAALQERSKELEEIEKEEIEGEETYYGLFQYKTDEEGEIIETRRLFAFECQDAARDTLYKFIQNNTDDHLFFDLEGGTQEDFFPEEDEEEDE